MKLLLANHQFVRFSGSEIHALEIAEHFLSKGWDVYFFSAWFSAPMRQEIKAAGGTVVSLVDIARMGRDAFDIVWTHHETMFALFHVIWPLRSKAAFHGILSYFIRLERMPIPNNMQSLDGIRFLANSQETLEHLEAYNTRDDVKVLRNIVSDDFFEHSRSSKKREMKRIAIISNHVPEELEAAAERLAEKVHVDIYGEKHTPKKIDAELLPAYDLVVSIGKTVQYCIVQAVPVYLYDRFGGPGYLNVDSFERHEYFNFSGRSEPIKRTSVDIARDIDAGYEAALATASILQGKYAQRYSLQNQMVKQFELTGSVHRAVLTSRNRFRVLLFLLQKRASIFPKLVAPRLMDGAGAALKNWMGGRSR